MKAIIRAALAAALALALFAAGALAEDEVRIAPAGAQSVEVVDASGAPVTRAYDMTISAFYLVGSDRAELRISAAGADPATAAFYSNFDSTATALDELARDGGDYLASTGVDSLATTGFESTMVAVMPGGVASGEFSGCTLLFASESDLDAFCRTRVGSGASWRFAGAAEDVGAETAAETADYALVFVDGAGTPVPGVVATVCDDANCTIVTSGADGRAAFSLVPYAYDVHVMQVPEGYAAPAEDYVLPAEGGELTIALAAA